MISDIAITKGVCNPVNQLSNFSKNWGMQHSKTEFHEFHGLILLNFCYSRSKVARTPTILTGKHVEFFEMSFEAMIWGNLYVNIADFGRKKLKNDPKFVRDSNSCLKLLTFQLSNVRELETIKYAFGYYHPIGVQSGPIVMPCS